MRILTLLDELEAIIDEAKPAPLSSKVMVDRDQLLDIIDDIRMNMPDVIRQAEQIAHQRQRILSDADAEAKSVVSKAEKQAERLVNEHEITTKAYTMAEEVLDNTQKNAREIRMGAIAYADDVLAELERAMQQQLGLVQKNRKELKGDQ
nr:ATPase [bacterium]